MIQKVEAPWTQEQVDNLNQRQQNPNLHPYTCGTKELHHEGLRGNQHTTLIADKHGWRCPLCSYTQNWAHIWDTRTDEENRQAFIQEMGEKQPELKDKFPDMFNEESQSNND